MSATRSTTARRLARTLLGLVALAAAGTPALRAGEPLAPKAELPPWVDGGAPTAIALEMLDVPTKEEVGVPAYPGSRVIKTKEGVELARVDLISPDPPETISAWYAEHLEGWKHKEIGGVSYFWKGDGEFDPQDPAAGRKLVPIVAVTQPRSFAQTWRDTKGEIFIQYRLAGKN